MPDIASAPTDDPVVHDGDQALRRLEQLGVDIDRLDAALDAGDVAARQATEFSPVMAAGMMRWLITVQVLREGLADDGWAFSEDRNSPE